MVKSVHMFQHVLQLIQVTVWHVPDDEALGLIGYVFQLQGTYWFFVRSRMDAPATSELIVYNPLRE
jgi:hypothetical protein